MKKRFTEVQIIGSLREVNGGSFHNDELLIKLFYLDLQSNSEKWSMPLRGFKPALNKFTTGFDDKMPRE